MAKIGMTLCMCSCSMALLRLIRAEDHLVKKQLFVLLTVRDMLIALSQVFHVIITIMAITWIRYNNGFSGGLSTLDHGEIRLREPCMTDRSGVFKISIKLQDRRPGTRGNSCNIDSPPKLLFYRIVIKYWADLTGWSRMLRLGAC